MPVKSEREYRNIVNIGVADEEKPCENEEDNGCGKKKEKREEENQYIVEGYATTFNSPYELWQDEDTIIKEQVDAAAFNGTDISDTIMQYDHEGRVFARVSNKTLEITPDQNGLKIRADLGGTEIGRQLYNEIKGGYITKMSFGFVVDDEETTYADKSSEKREVLRTIKHIKKLYDVSAVSIPANDQTEISARKFSDGVIAELTSEWSRQEQEARAKRIQKIRIMLEINK